MRLLLIHTGGTLMMRGGHPTPLVPDVYQSDLLTELPVLRRVADIETRIFSNLDSSDMQPHHWVELAQAVHEALDARGAGAQPATTAWSWRTAPTPWPTRRARWRSCFRGSIDR